MQEKQAEMGKKKKRKGEIRQVESKIPQEFFFSCVSLGIRKEGSSLPKQYF